MYMRRSPVKAVTLMGWHFFKISNVAQVFAVSPGPLQKFTANLSKKNLEPSKSLSPLIRFICALGKPSGGTKFNEHLVT